MSNKITGATALINLDYDLMHQAGHPLAAPWLQRLSSGSGFEHPH